MTKLLQFIYNTIVFNLASLRASFWGLFLKKIGKQCQIMPGVKFFHPYKIEIGSFTGINHHAEIGGHYGLKIGSYVMIGPYSQIITANHQYSDWRIPMKYQGTIGGPIVIDDDVWIGSFVMILPNIKIGRGTIIGAHSVVTHDVEPYSIVGGVPAKLIKYRFNNELISKAKKVVFKNKT